jgi:hypothetical protein
MIETRSPSPYALRAGYATKKEEPENSTLSPPSQGGFRGIGSFDTNEKKRLGEI